MEELEKNILAKCSLIQIVSSEEKRATEYVREVGKRLMVPRSSESKQKTIAMKFWSISKGMFDYGDSQETIPMDPGSAIKEAITYDGDSIFVFFDFHPYMKESRTIRLLREASFALKVSQFTKVIILVQPSRLIPIELEKDMFVMELPLPSVEVLRDRLSLIIKKRNERDKGNVLSQESFDKIVRAGQGLSRDEFDKTLAMCIVEYGKIDERAIHEVAKQKKQIIKKRGLLECIDTETYINDVGGLDNLKDWLRRRSYAFSTEAIEFGLPNPKGVLLVGVPGSGKSLMAKAIASEFNMPLYRLDIGAQFGKLVGQSEENMRNAIKDAEAVSPAVLWLEEIDKCMSGMNGGSGDNGTSSRVFSTLLTWLNEKTTPTFFVATANNISSLPPELLRKGRFDEIFFVDLPSTEERETIFRIHLKKRKRNPDSFNTLILAEMTQGFSGAEIEQVVISSLYYAFSEKKDITDEDLIRSINTTVPLSVTMKTDIDELRQWSRSGRAVLASTPRLENAFSVMSKGIKSIMSADSDTDEIDAMFSTKYEA